MGTPRAKPFAQKRAAKKTKSVDTATTPERAPALDDDAHPVELIIGHRFRDRALLTRALTHKSFMNEHDGSVVDGAVVDGHNERLEFLGDAVLGLIAAEKLFHNDLDAKEGDLTARRAAFVSAEGIVEKIGRTTLASHILTGKGVKRLAKERTANVLADAFEALVAAAYIDGGMGAATVVVDTLLGEPPTSAPNLASTKSRLQERIQKVLGSVPGYDVTRESGPDHAPDYRASVVVNGVVLGAANGKSTKDATKAAALVALSTIADMSDDELRVHVKIT